MNEIQQSSTILPLCERQTERCLGLFTSVQSRLPRTRKAINIYIHINACTYKREGSHGTSFFFPKSLVNLGTCPTCMSRHTRNTNFQAYSTSIKSIHSFRFYSLSSRIENLAEAKKYSKRTKNHHPTSSWIAGFISFLY